MTEEQIQNTIAKHNIPNKPGMNLASLSLLTL